MWNLDMAPTTSPTGNAKKSHKRKRRARFFVGDHAYKEREAVFVAYKDIHTVRWYAAHVTGSQNNKAFTIEWCEGQEEMPVVPSQIVSARDILQKDTVVAVHDLDRTDCYQEMVILESKGKGCYAARAKHGEIVTARFSEMMITAIVVDEFRKRCEGLPMPPKFMMGLTDIWFISPEKLFAEHTFCFTQAPSVDLHPCKEELCGMIMELGGTVVEHFDLLHKAPVKKFRFLITPIHCLTPKYLQALAANIPCVHPKWIVKTYKEKKYREFADYRLKSGDFNGKGEEQLVPWKERIVLLNNLRVGIFGPSHFYHTWRSIVSVGLGEPSEISENYSEKELEVVDMVLVEERAPQKLKDMCKEISVPVVTYHWLTQTLIKGKKIPFKHWSAPVEEPPREKRSVHCGKSVAENYPDTRSKKKRLS